MKIALGTVQFGLDYGVSNQNGQVKAAEVKNILSFSKEAGIDMLDTASGYGNSEKILGSSDISDFQIVTKASLLEESVDKVIDSFYKSLDDINRSQVYGLLIHHIDSIENKLFDSLFLKLHKLKQLGLIRKIGFSIYTPDQLALLEERCFEFDLIQLPINVFDTRFVDGGQLQFLKSKGVEIHSRSVFLQGVLLNLNNLPKYFSTWKRQFDIYQAIVRESELSFLEYALNFVLDISEVDKVLVGVTSKKQLQQIIQSIGNGDNLCANPINDVNLLIPSLWKL